LRHGGEEKTKNHNGSADPAAGPGGPKRVGIWEILSACRPRSQVLGGGGGEKGERALAFLKGEKTFSKQNKDTATHSKESLTSDVPVATARIPGHQRRGEEGVRGSAKLRNGDNGMVFSTCTRRERREGKRRTEQGEKTSWRESLIRRIRM